MQDRGCKDEPDRGAAATPVTHSGQGGRSIPRPIEILLVEDSPSDADLTIEAFREVKMRNNLSVVEDGVQAMRFLRRQDQYATAARPDVILLDLNLPRKDGREVLSEIKADGDLATIPVVVLTLSSSEEDYLRAQNLEVDGYITKPVEPGRFLDTVRGVTNLHFLIVTLPPIAAPSDASLAWA